MATVERDLPAGGANPSADAIPPALRCTGGTRRQVLAVALIGTLVLAAFASGDLAAWLDRMGDGRVLVPLQQTAAAWNRTMGRFGLTRPPAALRAAIRRLLDWEWALRHNRGRYPQEAAVFPTLTDEQRQFINTVRALAQDEFRERAPRWMDGTFPWDNMKPLAEMGVLGMAVPEEYGGLGLPIFDTALVLEEIAKVCYVTAMAVLGEVGVQTRIISHYAPEAIKRRILPAVCSGECLLAICMTEPDAGTDVANYKTNVDRVGNKLRLNGVKTLISRAEEAGMFVVFTRVDKKPGREGIGCVLVEKGTPGFTVTGSYHTMGGENLHEIRFEDVELPPENLVLEDGFRQLLNAFNTQRCLNPSISLGLAEGAFEEAVRYAKERAVFGRPVADFQGMRWKLAEMYRDIEASRSILYRACAGADPFPDPLLAAAAKITVNEMALRVTSEAIQVHGGYGFTDEFPVSRFYRGARYGTLGGGTTETLKDLVGRRVIAGLDPVDGILGLGAF